MKLIRQVEDQVEMRFSLEELILLRNVLSEVCNSLHFTDNDLVAIFDMNRPEAEEVLLHLDNALDRLDVLRE